MAKGPLVNNYHYKIIIYDKNNNIVKINYYKTAQEICNLYNCSRTIIYNKIKNPTIKSRKLIDMIIEKIAEPINITIPNPRINENIEQINTDKLVIED